MSRHALLLSATFLGLLAAAPADAKSELYQISLVSGSETTTIFGVNDKGIATGSWLDASGVEHGYFGPPDGSNYTTFDDPSGRGTEPRGISDGGYICGFGDSQKRSATSYAPWERDPSGTLTEITKSGVPLNDLCQGLNKNEVFAGAYFNSSLAIQAYIGKNAKYTKTVQLTGITNTGVAARGIDNAGDIVGWYYDTNGVENGFLTTGRKAQTVDFSGATYTTLEGINNKGEAAGYYQDSSGRIHGFVYTISTQVFKEIKIPAAVSFVQAYGINDKGQVGVNSDAGSFVYCPSQKDCTFGGTSASSKPPARHPAQRLHPLLP